jgi:hypothetical protein
MDVAVKGLLYLLEACRTNLTVQQFILIGGDLLLVTFTTHIRFL